VGDMGKEEYVEKLEKTIDELKKEIKILKKQVQVVNIVEINQDFHETRELVLEQKEKETKYKELREKWECYSCGRGLLRIHKFMLPNNKERYFRKCSFCTYRTQLKDFSENVEGLYHNQKIS
jgi:hypothetical protein